MTKIETRTFPQQASLDSAGAWKAPVLDQATIDFYLRRGRQERARAFAQMIRGVFSPPATRDSAAVHALPARKREAGSGSAHRTSAGREAA